MANYVGFANLPNQVHRKSVKKGFEFTLMVVGKRLHLFTSDNVNLLNEKDFFISPKLIQVSLFNLYRSF